MVKLNFSAFGLYLTRHKYLWTILAFLILIGFVDPNSLWYRYRLYERNETLREDIRRYEQQYAADARTLYELHTDPAAVEKVARVHLFMKTDNEDVYVIEKEQ